MELSVVDFTDEVLECCGCSKKWSEANDSDLGPWKRVMLSKSQQPVSLCHDCSPHYSKKTHGEYDYFCEWFVLILGLRRDSRG